MPSSYGRAVAAAVFVFALTVSPYAHADTSVTPIGDPYTDTLQLWSNIISTVEALAHDLATSLISIQSHTANSNGQTPSEATSFRDAQSAAAALAASSNQETATSSSLEDQSATSIGSVSNATSDQTTNSSNVKSAVLIQQIRPQPKSTAFLPNRQQHSPQHPTSSPKTNSMRSSASLKCPHRKIQRARNLLGSAIHRRRWQHRSPFAAANAINNLSNVTITNANLTASEIPALNYFPSTSTVSVSYGGTGTSIAPTYGQLLLGNGSGGYNLTATSSLGIVSGSASPPSSRMLE